MFEKVDCFGLTDVGLVRETNEDNFLVAQLEKSVSIYQGSIAFGSREQMVSDNRGQVFAVADGMGGHACGEQASRITLETVSEFIANTVPWFCQRDELVQEVNANRLEQAIHACQARLRADQHHRSECRGMGSTLTLAYVVWPTLHLVHVGDSRCYRYSNGRLEQLTVDHTVAEQMSQRSIPVENMPQQWHHALWNVIGGDEDAVTPQVQKLTLHVGDVLLLCTDGLTGCVGEPEIAAELSRDCTVEDSCRRLVDRANEQGGRDNITVLIARFHDADNVGNESEETEADAIFRSGSDPAADTVILPSQEDE